MPPAAPLTASLPSLVIVILGESIVIPALSAVTISDCSSIVPIRPPAVPVPTVTLMSGVSNLIVALTVVSNLAFFPRLPTNPPAVVKPLIVTLVNSKAAFTEIDATVSSVSDSSTKPTIPPAFPVVAVTVTLAKLIVESNTSFVFFFISPITPPAFLSAVIFI